MAIIKQPNGWNPWYNPKTVRNGYDARCSPFPTFYLPTRGFLVETYAAHCYLPTPWTLYLNPFDAFLAAGGATGTLIGSLAGMQSATNYFKEKPTGSWGIARDQLGIPTVGFCMGDAYKEHCYFYYSVTRIPSVPISYVLGVANIDVFQRSKLKRIYVAEGMVVRFVANPNPVEDSNINTSQSSSQFVLTLDIDQNLSKDITTSVAGDLINVYKKDGTTLKLYMVKVLPNWQIIVRKDIGDTKEPESGDFYRLNVPLCIEDPYMMSGFWQGAQGEINDSSPHSEYKVFKTTHICPYDEIKFVGAYVYREIGGSVTQATVGSEFSESIDNEWAWYYYSGSQSSIYGISTDRYFMVDPSNASSTTTTTTIDGSTGNDLSGDYITPTLKKFPIASEKEISDWKKLDGINYIRLEINNGGSASRQNWHSPILTKCWLKQKGKYFAILGHPESNIIDISLRDVTNTSDLDTTNSTGGSILNQYAWMINEHYSSFLSGDQLGFLEGDIKSVDYNESTNISVIKVTSRSGSYGTIARNAPGQIKGEISSGINSFIIRFLYHFPDTYSGGSGTPFKTMFVKHGLWKVFNENGNIFEMVNDESFYIEKMVDIINGKEVDIVNDNVTLTTQISYEAKVIGDMRGNSVAGLYFDEPYKRIDKQRLPVFTYDFQQALDASGKPLPLICVNMSYRCSPMSIFLPQGSIIGVTGGRWWGLGVWGLSHVFSENGLDMVVTIPSAAKGISSFFHRIRQQDWIFFQDLETNRVTLRTGNLDFTETPRRAELCIGFPSSVANYQGFPINFDKTKDRVKLISMSLPEESSKNILDEFGPSALTFQLGNQSDYFGFPSTGDGVFDFQALRDNGFGAGSVDYSKYKSGNYFISPVYVYTKRNDDITFHNKHTLELGISTEKPLYVKNGNPNNIKIEYIKDVQTLENVGFIDSHHMEDGEIMVIYGKKTSKFKMGESEIDTSKWPTLGSIYVVGTANNALLWGTPTVDQLQIEKNKNYQYPIMLLNSCNYITSIYNRIGGVFVIFAQFYDKNNNKFIGGLIINRGMLNEGLTICNSVVDPPDLNFWFRNSRIPEQYLINSDLSYVDPNYVLTKTYVNDEVIDFFVRIIGPVGTRCQINSTISDISIMSSAILSEGTSIILYGSDQGIRMLSSHDLTIWAKSEIILARNADGPLLLGNHLFYISSEGITIKYNILQSVYDASNVNENAGFSSADIESVQEQFDSAFVRLIGSDKISSQRLSGHISHDGIYKIFYYNNDNILCCLESEDTVIWKVARNF